MLQFLEVGVLLLELPEFGDGDVVNLQFLEQLPKVEVVFFRVLHFKNRIEISSGGINPIEIARSMGLCSHQCKPVYHIWQG